MSDVLTKLEKQEIKSKVEGDKILFFSSDYTEPQEEMPQFDPSSKIVQEAMKKMNEMDPEELEKLKQQIGNMTPEEREELMKKARDLFSDSSK